MNRYLVRLDVSGISDEEDSWDDWCNNSSVQNIEFNALQNDGCEHWIVSANTEQEARETTIKTISTYAVTIFDVTYKDKV